jgi:2-polyprenyl-6-methoxyphenol hydroxylase-like FAD-dependent oxidoreductase
MTSSLSSFDICIHGAGFVGRTLSLLLAQSGLRVALLSTEPAKSESVDIRAFALSASSKDLLASVNAWPLDVAITPVLSMQVFGDAGGHVQLDVPEHAEALNWIVDVPALENVLKEQVAGEPNVVCLAEGTACEAKLHVVCEGRTSRITTELGLKFEMIRYPQHAIAARLMCELPHDRAARQWFTERGEVLALLPMQGSAGREVALVWSLESNRAKAMLAASDADFTAALEASCNKALGAMHLSSARALWPLQLARTDQWTGQSSALGTWVIAGDAAHTVHPLAGQGLNLGLGDAAHLAKALTEVQGDSPLFRPTQTKLNRALQSYARARLAAAAPIAGVTDGLHLLFAHDSVLLARARNLGMSWLNRASSVKNFLIKQAQ